MHARVCLCVGASEREHAAAREKESFRAQRRHDSFKSDMTRSYETRLIQMRDDSFM